MLGVLLTGGGARGAYQVGVLSALAPLLERLKLPVRAWSGISAGAINGSFLAGYTSRLPEGLEKLSEIWSTVTPDQIYRTDLPALSRVGLGWITDIGLGSLKKKKNASSLLDTSPLRELLSGTVSVERIEQELKGGTLNALMTTAFCYDDNVSHIFVTSQGTVKDWQRTKRKSIQVDFHPDQVHASCAIPLLFPPVSYAGKYYADGVMRNSAPISPLIHAGATKILVLGVHTGDRGAGVAGSPRVATILGQLLNSLFFDSIEMDLERLKEVSKLIRHIKQDGTSETQPLVDAIFLRPTVDLGILAQNHARAGFPRPLRFLLGSLGNSEEATDLASYLLFHPSYTKELMAIGRADGEKFLPVVEKFLTTP